MIPTRPTRCRNPRPAAADHSTALSFAFRSTLFSIRHSARPQLQSAVPEMCQIVALSKGRQVPIRGTISGKTCAVRWRLERKKTTKRTQIQLPPDFFHRRRTFPRFHERKMGTLSHRESIPLLV